MLQFSYEPQPTRVVFGAGRLDQLADEVARLGATRVLALSTPGQRRLAEWAAELLGDRVRYTRQRGYACANRDGGARS